MCVCIWLDLLLRLLVCIGVVYVVNLGVGLVVTVFYFALCFYCVILIVLLVYYLRLRGLFYVFVLVGKDSVYFGFLFGLLVCGALVVCWLVCLRFT